MEEEKKVAADRKAVITAAVKAMKTGKMSVRAAAAECKQKGVQIGKSALHNWKVGKTKRDTPGAPPKLPDPLIKELVQYIEAVRVTFRIPVFTCQIRAWVQHMIEGTVLQLRFKDGVVGMDWCDE